MAKNRVLSMGAEAPRPLPKLPVPLPELPVRPDGPERFVPGLAQPGTAARIEPTLTVATPLPEPLGDVERNATRCPPQLLHEIAILTTDHDRNLRHRTIHLDRLGMDTH